MNEQDQRNPMQRRLVTPYSRRRVLKRGVQAGAGFVGAMGLGPILAACGIGQSASPGASTGASAGGPPTTLKVLLANHTGFYAMVTPDFEQQNNATIEFTREAFGAMPSILTPAFEAGGESWDVVYLWRAWVDQYKDFLTPLTEVSGYQPPDESNLRWEAIEAAKSSDGTWYGGPSNVYTYVLYCNRQKFEDAGLAIPATYEDFVAAAEQFTANGQYGYVDGWAPLYLFPKWCVWLHLNGGKFYGSDGSVNFDTPEAMQATQDMIDLLPYMPSDSIESPWGIYDVEAKKVFMAGDAAMMIDYQHLWYQSRDPDLSALGEDPVRVAIVPGKAGGPPTGGQSVGECFAIPNTSEKKDLALQLVNYYASASTQLGLLTRREELHDFDPADESGFPSFLDPYQSDEISDEDQPIVDVTLEQAENPELNQRYGTRAGYQRISEIVEAAVSSALHGSNVEQEHGRAQQEINQFLEDNPGM